MRDYDKLRRERFAALTDPRLKEYYAQVRPSLRETGIEMLRQRRAAAPPGPQSDPDIDQRDVAIDGPHGPVPTRIFTPKGKMSGPRGIYLHTHGAYASTVRVEDWVPVNLEIAKNTGCVVVAPMFRNPPEHNFPVPLDDCMAAFLWTHAHARELGGRPDGICVGGGCVGANLAAALCIMARDAGGPQPASQYLYCPVFDMRCDTESHYENSGPGYTLSRDDCIFTYTNYLGDWDRRHDPLASVILTPTLAGLPQAIIDVGEWDVLRDESVAYANRLRDAGVPVEIFIRKETSHGASPVSKADIDAEMARFLAKTTGAGLAREKRKGRS